MPAICFALIWAKGLLAFYNIANDRKDEAMTEYGPQFRTSRLLSSKGKNCSSEQGYHVSRLTVRNRTRRRSFLFQKEVQT